MSYRILGLDDAQNPVPYARPPVAANRRMYEAFAKPLRSVGNLSSGLVRTALMLAIPVGLLVLLLK